MLRRLMVVTILVMALAMSSVSAREWTDISGTHHVSARLLQCRDNMVWLEKSNSKLVIVPIEKLSLADRTYVARECPGQVSTRELSTPAAEAAKIAKTAQPAKAPASLQRERNKAAFHLASLSRRQDPPTEELEIEPTEEMPAEEVVEEPVAEAVEQPVEETAVEPADEPAAEEPVTEEPALDSPANEPPTEELVEEPVKESPASAEELPGPEVVASAEPPANYIYTGKCRTFHLIDKIRTGAYWYKGKHYLAMLYKAGEDANYLYYDSNHPDGQIIQWYFSKTERCCKFWVWKRTDTGHGHYEREYRERPN